MSSAANVTGIPTDALVIGFGTLCAAIGGWMVGQLQKLQADAAQRGTAIALLRQMMRQVCKKLDIPYNGDSDES